MDTSFDLFPESASTISARVDAVYIYLLVVSGIATAVICALVLYFGIRYRRHAVIARGKPSQNFWMEIGWAILPLGFGMSVFAWGASIYYDIKTPPPDAVVVEVVGKQWMWKVQHASGRSEINELHLAVNQPVRLRMISEDVIHSFFVPVFRVKQDVLPGYYTQMWFEPTKLGRFHLFCAEYCGTEHSLMRGEIIVMSADDYSEWLSGETGETPQAAGERLFERFRCATCHKSQDTNLGPPLTGLFGRAVLLEGGGTAIANEQYLRDAILNPAKQVVAGYKPTMPVYQGQLDETQVLQLIAYMKSLKGEPAAPAE